MDPDAIFIILLYFILFVLTVVSIVGLSKKIWASVTPTFIKILTVGLLLFLLIIGIFSFDTVDTGKAQIIVLCASFIIAFNWSIDISKKLSNRTSKIKTYITISVLTIAFSFLIPFTLYYLGNLFDKLNLMGSGG